MHRPSRLSGLVTLLETTTIPSRPLLGFLNPAPTPVRIVTRSTVECVKRRYSSKSYYNDAKQVQELFFSALFQAWSCPKHNASQRKHTHEQAHAGQRRLLSRKITRRSLVDGGKAGNDGHLKDVSKGEDGAETTKRLQPGDGGQPPKYVYEDPDHYKKLFRKPTRVQDSLPGPHKGRQGFFQPSPAVGSHLPPAFYEDVDKLQTTVNAEDSVHRPLQQLPGPARSDAQDIKRLEDQIKLLRSVRELEEKLARTKSRLHDALEEPTPPILMPRPPEADEYQGKAISLTKEDYLGLVDLYFYSHKRRFEPDSPDESPTPLFLDDYSFRLSADFTAPTAQESPKNDGRDEDVSPLKHIEEMLKSNQLHEVTTMQIFVELLLDDKSSNRALHEAYKRLPDPGVAYLPSGAIRLFLQRMSTPWVKTEKTMLRYMSLIDDMQRAGLPITKSEWSSAIHLTGRCFSQVIDSDVTNAFKVWREMEERAHVKASNVTFNILFDIAIRAGKHALGESVLREMHERGLRLNRLGRVSLIYYHGLRGDGDGVRRAYRDFVEAKEIVDTLVLNCVIASLINAQEPVAAEQIYERMKGLQQRLRKGVSDTGEQTLFMKYPPPGSDQINSEMASNALGRVLVSATRLRKHLPDHHTALQNAMPLTPDLITFRTMVAHHASTSGDLDRLTVLISEMMSMFELPVTTLVFQLLFKGFALHGTSKSESNKWTTKRLELVWTACLDAIRKSQKSSTTTDQSANGAIDVPTVHEVNATALENDRQVPQLQANAPLHARKIGPFDEFIIDLVNYPRERQKPIHERKAPLTSDHGESQPFVSPFFRSPNAEPVSESSATEEDGEYTLPDQLAQTKPLRPERVSAGLYTPIIATRPLVIWLIRAYQRTSNSRKRLEELWGQIRKIWRPADETERDAVVRVLKKALRDCDRLGDG